MIVRYSFLWSREAIAGETDGRKDRPCVIITAIRRAADGRLRVRVLPITHRPTDESRNTPIPPRVKRRLGLGGDAPLSARAARQSALRIVLDEANEFFWPGWTFALSRGRSPAYAPSASS
jgi:hypothetical protein